MHEQLWSNERLRTFIISLQSRGIFEVAPLVDDVDRGQFRHQAMLRVVPEVERRVLADVGAAIDPDGVATVVYEVAEKTTWGRRHTWLMVTEDPWAYLTDLVTREIRDAYRYAVRPRGDVKTLKGIAAASSRRGLGSGGEDAAGPA